MKYKKPPYIWTTFQPLDGSNMQAPAGAVLVGPASTNKMLEIIIFINGKKDFTSADMTALELGKFKILSHSNLKKQYGPQKSDIDLIKQFATIYGLQFGDVNHLTSSINLKGTVGKLNKAFNVGLLTYAKKKHHFTARVGPISVPTPISQITRAIIGLDARPLVKPSLRKKKTKKNIKRPVDISTAMLPSDIASIYNYPISRGEGQCVGIISVCGNVDYDSIDFFFSDTDYCGLDSYPIPIYLPESGVPAGNIMFGCQDELNCSIEIIGSLVPDANIVAYLGKSNTESGIIHSLREAINDTDNNPNILSISWNFNEVGDELHLPCPPGSLCFLGLNGILSLLMCTASGLGITVICSSGDVGANYTDSDGKVHLMVPSSNPLILACGGTNIVSLTSDVNIQSEVVWNDDDGSSGGGISDIWDIPSYQSGLGPTLPPSVNSVPERRGRGVPDVAAIATTNYNLYVDGDGSTYGGTSCVAPLIAALFAKVFSIRGLQRVGSVNHYFYENPGICNDVTSGNNQFPDDASLYYRAKRGWDACTGWGSPDGAKLLAVI